MSYAPAGYRGYIHFSIANTRGMGQEYKVKETKVVIFSLRTIDILDWIILLNNRYLSTCSCMYLYKLNMFHIFHITDSGA